MRSDRGTALAAILVVLCCLGGTVTAGSIVTHRVLVASVVSSLSSGVVKVGSQSYSATMATEELMPFIDQNLLSLYEIVEHHNLPPPMWVIVLGF
jgi:hypothetical protein